MQIAKILTADKVLTVKAYYAKRDGKAMPNNRYRWDFKTIAGILEHLEYTGCTVNFKTYSKSHKLKKRLQNAPENYRIFPNTQPAIIEEKVFERVQELRAYKRRPTKTGRQGLFSGLLYCADCGEKLYFCTTKSFTTKQEHYVCSHYKSNTGTCSAHFIREETLKLFVLRRIFDVTAMFFDDIQSFQKIAHRQRFAEAEKAVKRQRKELEQARKRIAELDRIFKRIYEDDINGTISHERFLKLSAEYEAEQRKLTEFVKAEQAAVDTYEQDRTDFDSFAAVIRKYVGIRELTPAIVNELVKKIIVHAPDKSSGHRRQKIEIVWNFIGELEQDEDKQTIERQRKSRAAQPALCRPAMRLNYFLMGIRPLRILLSYLLYFFFFYLKNIDSFYIRTTKYSCSFRLMRNTATVAKDIYIGECYVLSHRAKIASLSVKIKVISYFMPTMTRTRTFAVD